jgi:hypothetical protein
MSVDWIEDLLKKSKLYGEYYTLELKDYFSKKVGLY